jgi:glycosyltransferase involved in cell wall biosynthesis
MVTVTNEYLKNVMLEYNSNVKILPNLVDPDLWNLNKDIRQVPGLTIGVFGGDSHVKDWQILPEIFTRLHEKYPFVTFLVSGSNFEYLRLPFVKHMNWVPVQYYPALVAQFDIGICPLEDTNFNKSKSPIKFYEFAQVNAPVVASPVVYGNEIQHGKTGFLAQTPDEYVAYLSELIENSAKRKSMGRSAKEWVLEHRNLQKGWKLWRNVYREVVSGK